MVQLGLQDDPRGEMLAVLWVDHVGWAAGSPVERWHVEKERKIHKRERNLSCVIILLFYLKPSIERLGPTQSNTLSVSIFLGCVQQKIKASDRSCMKTLFLVFIHLFLILYVPDVAKK